MFIELGDKKTMKKAEILEIVKIPHSVFTRFNKNNRGGHKPPFLYDKDDILNMVENIGVVYWAQKY